MIKVEIVETEIKKMLYFKPFTMNEIRRKMPKTNANIIFLAIHNLKEKHEIERVGIHPATYKLIK